MRNRRGTELSVPVLPPVWDTDDDDDWGDELVTDTSRAISVGKKTERKVHGTQRFRTARGRLFRSGGRAPCTVQKLQRLSPCPRKMGKPGRGGDKVSEMGSPAEIISLVHDIDSSGDVHLNPSFMNQDPRTSNLDVKQSNLISLEHSLANKDEEEDISCTEFFDHYDCSGKSLKIYVDELCGGSSNVDELCTVSCDLNHTCILDMKHGDLTAGEELQPSTLDHIQPFSTWELKVVKVLDIVRRRALTEFNTKQIPVHTRFCDFNIAFFDHDKESEIKHGTPFHKIHPSRHRLLDGSVNVISIKVAKSDVPINIYGTVLARDRNDYRCVYLFKRARDNPQLMTKRNRMLALTGPYRALGAAGTMYFEFNLKIKGKEETDDQDFCKGLLERNAFRSTLAQPCTYSLESCLSTESRPSTVDMVCMPVRFALEASLEVNVLNGQSFFTGKISAWTSGNDQNKTILDDETEIVLYDSKVPGTEIKLESGGSISLSRRIVSVPLNGDLVLKISVWENCKHKHRELVLGHDVEDHTCKLGPYELQVKIIWSGVIRQHLPKMWKLIGDNLVFW